MILELVNDSTLTATYPNQTLINRINNASQERIFFPKEFMVATAHDNLF